MPIELPALFEKHAHQPRRCEVLSDASLVETVSSDRAGRLTLFLKLVRASSGQVLVEWATFQASEHPALIACASWLTHRIAGEPLDRVRAIGPEAVLMGLGVVPELDLSNTTYLDKLQAGRLAALALRNALARV